MKDSIVQLPIVNPAPTSAEERDPNFCPYHRRKGHTLEQCFVFGKIFNRKLQDEEIILQDEGARNVHERPFLNHNDNKGKGHAMMMSTPASTVGIEGEPDINQMAGRVQHLHKFKHFYDQMDFNP